MAITHGRNNSLLALIDQLENNDPKSIIHEKDSIFFLLSLHLKMSSDVTIYTEVQYTSNAV